MTDPADAARFLAQYAKAHNAGAFATPTRKELTAAPETLREWRTGDHRAVAVARRLSATSRRRDFTGRPIVLPAGATVVTHLAATPGAPLPDLGAEWVMAYADDANLSPQLAERYRPAGTRVTAAGELITVWGPPDAAYRYAPHDEVTVASMPLALPLRLRPAVLDEVASVDAWHDDFPYYSDGSWSAVSLRGYRPDPRWGIKPTEMPKRWQAAHPEAARYRCEWTTLAHTCPRLVGWVRCVSWWGRLERVRLLRMTGRAGKPARLARHSDITDRAAGTRDGQVVRFHVPLVTHPEVRMLAWDLRGRQLQVHLPPWRCAYLDIRKPHAVVNPTAIDRIHLVVDVLADPRIRRHLTEAA